MPSTALSAIFPVAIVLSASFAEVITPSVICPTAIVSSGILAAVIALFAILAVVTANPPIWSVPTVPSAKCEPVITSSAI